jgi:hypothetical protein
LIAPPPESTDENRSTLNRLAFEVAFAYREQTGIDIDEHFFDSKRATSNGCPATNIAQTPRRRVQVSGYKWEEGLCEWVAATPLAKPPTRLSSAQPPPNQFPTPNEETNNTPPVALPLSPKVVISIQPPPQIHVADSSPPKVLSTRPALQPRSANQQLRSPPPQQKKPPSFLKPALPKQVHLKEERAKKRAAALLAQQSSASSRPPPPPQQERVRSKRSLSLADTRGAGEGTRSRSVSVDTDELGMLTPARKKSKRVRIGGLSSSSAFRTSLPAQTLDGMSEDELGL